LNILKVFRVATGEEIAHYRTHAEITDMASGSDGRSLILGAIDGSLVILAIADCSMETHVEYLTELRAHLYSDDDDQTTILTARSTTGGAGALSMSIIARLAAKARRKETASDKQTNQNLMP